MRKRYFLLLNFTINNLTSFIRNSNLFYISMMINNWNFEIFGTMITDFCIIAKTYFYLKLIFERFFEKKNNRKNHLSSHILINTLYSSRKLIKNVFFIIKIINDFKKLVEWNFCCSMFCIRLLWFWMIEKNLFQDLQMTILLLGKYLAQINFILSHAIYADIKFFFVCYQFRKELLYYKLQ